MTEDAYFYVKLISY